MAENNTTHPLDKEDDNTSDREQPNRQELRRRSSSLPSSTEISSDRRHEFEPPFLVRTKSVQEKQDMHAQYERRKRTKSPYDTLRRVYERFSTSALLENKAAVARDHLGRFC